MKRRPTFSRAFPLDDIEITRSGDGRTVTAYAAVFANAYEVTDVHGHYFESINRAAFDRFLGRGIQGVECLYNHGLTRSHTPSERFALPLGAPLEIKPDGKGLLTVTRYAKTPLADEVLELIRAGAVTAQSFQGPVHKSSPPRPHASGLQHFEHLQLGLRNYGPSSIAINSDASIIAVRSLAELAEEIADLTDEERAQLFSTAGAPADPDPTTGTSQQNPDPQTEPVDPEVDPPAGPSEYEERVAALRRRSNS